MEKDPRDEQNRRSFITTATAAGAAAFLGSGAAADRRLNPRIRRPTVRPSADSEEPLTLTTVPKMQTDVGRPVSRERFGAGDRDPDARVPLPAAKSDLLNAIRSAPGGETTIESLGVFEPDAGRGGAIYAPTVELGALAKNDKLAAWYAGGITLTSTGCTSRQRKPSAEFQEDPILYDTSAAVVYPPHTARPGVACSSPCRSR
ncbi:MAG TPA: twin-arginine translocation signal domain-containing protein [Armatimonadota bacterium]|nr:twin-arginine translocation signal domain-containing protein [Armatimonadota bacterium]